MGTHDALDVRALEHERLLAVVGVDEVGEVQVAVAEARRIAAVRLEVGANRLHVVLHHLLAAGGAGQPAVGARDAREHGGRDVGLVG